MIMRHYGLVRFRSCTPLDTKSISLPIREQRHRKPKGEWKIDSEIWWLNTSQPRSLGERNSIAQKLHINNKMLNQDFFRQHQLIVKGNFCWEIAKKASLKCGARKALNVLLIKVNFAMKSLQNFNRTFTRSVLMKIYHFNRQNWPDWFQHRLAQAFKLIKHRRLHRRRPRPCHFLIYIVNVFYRFFIMIVNVRGSEDLLRNSGNREAKQLLLKTTKLNKFWQAAHARKYWLIW